MVLTLIASLGLSLLPQANAYAWSFQQPPQQCTNLSIAVTGNDGQPPYRVLILPFGPSPLAKNVEARKIMDIPFPSGQNRVQFQLNYPANSQFVAVVSLSWLISRLFVCFFAFLLFFCFLFCFHCLSLLFYDSDFEMSTSSDSGRALFSLHSPVTSSEEVASLTTAFSHATDEVGLRYCNQVFQHCLSLRDQLSKLMIGIWRDSKLRIIGLQSSYRIVSMSPMLYSLCRPHPAGQKRFEPSDVSFDETLTSCG